MNVNRVDCFRDLRVDLRTLDLEFVAFFVRGVFFDERAALERVAVGINVYLFCIRLLCCKLYHKQKARKTNMHKNNGHFTDDAIPVHICIFFLAFRVAVYYNFKSYAGIAQLLERFLAKEEARS